MIAALAALLLAASHPAVPNFGHVIVVVFENHERGQIVGSSAAPTFAALAKQDASLDDYDAVTHPSLPNYLALVSGSTHGITSDCTGCTVNAESLADTLPAKRRTWKTYAEDLPSAGFTGATSGRYAKKHDPFLYFTSVLAKPKQRKRVVPLTQLEHDVGHHRLPAFSLVVPNLCDDMHDCSVATGDKWLKQHVVPLADLPRTVVFVVFDEGKSDAGGGGNIDALVLGPYVKPGSSSSAPTSHYGLLRTIEQAWHLPYLGASANATPITGIWR